MMSSTENQIRKAGRAILLVEKITHGKLAEYEVEELAALLMRVPSKFLPKVEAKTGLKRRRRGLTSWERLIREVTLQEESE